MKRGFTLIELLVVIAIIGILSSVVLASLSTARLKASDAQTEENFSSLQTALALYYNTNGHMPPNNNPGYGDCSVPNASLAPLVSGGYISKIPLSPNPAYPYCYYDYGSGSSGNGVLIGAVFVAMLQSGPPTSVNGYPGTCRFANAGTNWCDLALDNYYCICNPY
ncbi:MAG: type II secretion system protein [Minisyncoccia bacterium]